MLDNCICDKTDKKSRWAKIVLLSNLCFSTEDIVSYMSIGYGALSDSDYDYGIMTLYQAEEVLGVDLRDVNFTEEPISTILCMLNDYIKYFKVMRY